jgi:beta-N-acetylhexosaminidase
MALVDSKAVIFSVEGLMLSDAERDLFADVKPLGFILFGRNCEGMAQVAQLCADLRSSVGWHCPILIDQEGGRVQRLKPPVWRSYPPMKHFGDLALEDEAKALEDLRFTVLQLGEELIAAGVNVNCAPVLDVLSPATHDVIGDRAFGGDAALVARMGLSVCRSLLAVGVTPIVKHLPGHGLAGCDSHKELPIVDAPYERLLSNDFDAFRILFESDVGSRVWGMAAHVIYSCVDAEHPASVSPTVIADVIRGAMGFDGVLVSDDLDMEALAEYGDVAARTLATLEAGCDVALYCAGELGKMQEIAKTVPKLSEKARERLQRA